ncbi:MAG: hypothetical protein ACI9T9_000813 [Oleiphilaceae bacterium]|jgi:hypothetical protein
MNTSLKNDTYTIINKSAIKVHTIGKFQRQTELR